MERLEIARLKINEKLNVNSKAEDLKESAWVRARIDQKRREEDRVQGGDFMQKYGGTLALIIVFLFSYLMLDNTNKTHTQDIAQLNSISESNTAQIVAACGGSFQSNIAPKNETAAVPTNTNLQIPFIGGG